MNKKIVIVDPDSNVLHILTHLFKQQGIKTYCFTKGEEALNTYLLTNKEEIDLVIIERTLIDMDGLAVAAAMQKKSKSPPFLILSSLNTEKEIQKALQAGAKGYICKPFDPNKLVITASKVMR